MGVEGKQLQKDIRRLSRETDGIDCRNGFKDVQVKTHQTVLLNRWVLNINYISKM